MLALPLEVGRDGVIRISGTRVTLDSVIYAFQDGASAEEITYQYPSLDLADTYLIIAYYLKNRGEVEAYLKHRERLIAEARASAERQSVGIRERLMARRRANDGLAS